MAASTSWKTPASIRRTLPAPPSSAGVPITWMRPAKGRVAERGGERGAGARAGGGDHVVAARVADARQRVVLGHDRHGRTGARARRWWRGTRWAARRRRARPRRPCLARNSVEPRRGLLLLEAELGVVVDLEADALRARRRAGRPPPRPCSCAVPGRARRLMAICSAANSSLAALTRAGSASRSKVVMAMVLAAASMPCAGQRAAPPRRRTRACGSPCPSGAIAIMGWMVGITWLTLPMSEEPRRSGIGRALGEAQPSACWRRRDRAASGCASSARRRCRAGCTLSVQPVAWAAPSAQAEHALVQLPHRVDARRPHVERRRRRTPG